MINLLKQNQLLINDIKKEKSVDTLILFGSYGENKQTINSDLDLCILFKTKTSKNKKKEILSMYNESIDLSDFDDLPTLLQYKIFLKGVFLKNKKKKNQLITTLKMQLFDFLPTQNRILKRKGLPEINLEVELQ